MKKFRFKLSGLLRLRLSQESEIKRQLSEIQMAIREKEDEINKTDDLTMKWSLYYNEVIAKRVNTMELSLIDHHIQNLGRFKEQQLIGREILKKKRDDILLQYESIRRAVKTLESIRDRRLADYMEEWRKEEEKDADEMATLRFARERMAV